MAVGGSMVAFVSPHGFGHAARVSAVLERLVELRPEVRITVVTTVPEWFFRDSLPGHRFEYRRLQVDVGLVQHDSLTGDLGATLRALDGIVPPSRELLGEAKEILREARADVVLADIAPLGIEAGHAVGIPTVLVENFTWDWIYTPFVPAHAEFRELVRTLATTYAAADIHVQTPPVCRSRSHAIRVAPIARECRAAPRETRERLGVATDVPLALVSMGGIEWRFDIARVLAAEPSHFVLIGRTGEAELPANVTVLSQRSEYHHPDLVAAADVVVGKLGYSTVAETLASACPFAYVERHGFAEYEVLSRYVEARVPTRRLTEKVFRHGHFGDVVGELMRLPRAAPVAAAGGRQVAEILAGVLPG